MKRTTLFAVAFLLGCGVVYAADNFPPGFQRSPAQYPEPGLTFTENCAHPKPTNLLYSASPDDIIKDAEAWKARGIDGFFMSGCVNGWQSDIWATDGQPETIGRTDGTLEKARRATEVCAELGMETYVLMAFHKHFDWFDDVAWQHVEHKFAQFAMFAREAGCKGVAIDAEYIMDQYYFEWPGYDYDGYTREDLIQTMRERMMGVARAMYDVFPDMVFLTLPELEFRLGSHIQLAWVEEAARRDAPGGVHYCMGYTYRNHNLRYVLAQGWLNNTFMHHLLSRRAWKYWQERCSLAPGVWPFGMPEYLGHGPELTPEELRHAMAGALMMGRRYMWVFSGACREQLLERNMDAYTREEDIKDYIRVLAAKETVANPKYVALAEEIGGMKLRDYSTDLGLSIECTILGPNDYGRLTHVPKSNFTSHQQEEFWALAVDRLFGRSAGMQKRFGTRTDWMLVGPFPNEGIEFKGYDTVYPPEKTLDLSAEYDGVDGKVRWREYTQDNELASVDLTKVLAPTQQVCAYALCYVTVAEETPAWIRLGTNDYGKLWLGGQLVWECPQEGGAILDRDTVPVTLPAGTTPILLKVCNGEGGWGFVFRITDEEGSLLSNVKYSLAPPDAEKGTEKMNEGGLSESVRDRGVVDLGNTARLQRVLAKARRGEKVTVGTIGGSITQGAVASAPEKRWADLVAQWWRERFPDTEIAFVNAGIGATGSNLGAHRVGRHLLAQQPDFVVVEYAVNDRGSPLAAETFEGVLRQILRQPNVPAVLVLFMMDHQGNNVQAEHEPVARYYGLPMVSYRDALWPEIQAGRLEWNAIAGDTVHPNDQGHAYCAALIAEALERVLATLPSDDRLPEPPPLPASKISDVFEHAAYLGNGEVTAVRDTGWQPQDDHFFGTGWVADEPGSVFECTVEGTAIAIAYHKVKGDVGIVEASVDDQPPIRIDAYFENDWGGGYTPYQLLGRDLAPGQHTVRVELLDEKNPASNGHAFRLVTILAAGRAATPP